MRSMHKAMLVSLIFPAIPASAVTISGAQEAATFCAESSDAAAPEQAEAFEAVVEAERGVHPTKEVSRAMFALAAIDIAAAAESKEACLEVLREGQAMFEDVLSSNTARLVKKRHKLSRMPEVRDVQQAIIDHWVSDQAGRGAYVALQTDERTGAKYWANRLATGHLLLVDEASRLYMTEVLETWDWIDRKRFGSAVSDHAWILVQHADSDPVFQQSVLTRMKPFLESGAIWPKHYAYLWDRVAVNTGKEQLYGTQPDWECVDGKMKLKPIADPENVNKRRAEMGLNSVEDGLVEMERGVCG